LGDKNWVYETFNRNNPLNQVARSPRAQARKGVTGGKGGYQTAHWLGRGDQDASIRPGWGGPVGRLTRKCEASIEFDEGRGRGVRKEQNKAKRELSR